MATGFKVSTSDLSNAMRDLKTKNKSLGEKLSDLQSKEKTLSGKWEGDAKKAFEEAFNKDVQQINKFIELVNKYAEAMDTIAESYREAEKTNSSTAKNRTY